MEEFIEYVKQDKIQTNRVPMAQVSIAEQIHEDGVHGYVEDGVSPLF